MPHVTKLSDYELKRGDPQLDTSDTDEGRHAKVVTAETKAAPTVSSTATVKDVEGADNK